MLVALPLCLLGAAAALAQTYHNMAAQPFSASFSDLATWTTPTKGSWSGVATGGTATIPDATRVTTQSNTGFSSGTSGGIQKGTEALLFLSTGATDNSTSVALDLLLNMTGRLAGTLSFDAATVSNSPPTSPTLPRKGSLRVYYSTDSTTWTELSATNLPYVATNDGVAASASVSLALPSALNEQPTVKLRFYYHNSASPGAGGNRPKISIDNVSVTSSPSVAGLPEITSPLTATATAGEPFTYTITANGSPSSYSVSTLPAGLTIDSSTGVISGTPTTSETANLTISATNGVGTGSAVLVLTINVNPNAPVVSDGSTTATVGTPFSYQISATNSPASYSSGTLPAGLSLDTTTGLISGTPTVGGTFNNITISASNSFGSDNGVLNIVIASAPILTGSFSASCYVGQAFSYKMVAIQNPGFYNAQAVLDGLIPGVAYDGNDLISGTPTTAGTYTFTIIAQNTLGADTKNFTLKVIDPADQALIPLTVVINKFVNATPDKIELLVIGDGTPGSTVDMRGMIIKDFSSTLDTDSGGQYEFSTSPLWSAVPAGTLIVLSAGNTETDVDVDSSDFVLKVNLGNQVYFTALKIEQNASFQSFDIATGEMVMIKPAGYGALGVAGGIHAFGSNVPATLPALYSQWKAFTGNKLSATGASGTNAGVYATNSTSSLADFIGSGATGNVAVGSMPVFGVANNATNQTYINSLRTAPHTALQNWRFEKFGVYTDTGAVLAGDNEDFDGDGISNLIEYATGTDPKVANASVVTTAKPGNFLTLTFPVINDSSLTYTVLGTNDLGIAFTEATGSSNTVGGVTTYTDDVSLAGAATRRFLRLKVSYTE